MTGVQMSEIDARDVRDMRAWNVTCVQGKSARKCAWKCIADISDGRGVHYRN